MASNKKHNKRQPWLSKLFHYASEFEGRRQSEQIGTRTIHTVECGPVASIGPITSPEWAIAGYRIRLINADGRWTQYEFNLAGQVRSTKTGTALEAE